jgi:acyl carrier protein
MILNKKELKAVIRKVIADKAGIEIEKLKPEDHIVDDLGIDSLGVMEMTMQLEAELGLEDDSINLDALFEADIEFKVENVEEFIIKLLS